MKLNRAIALMLAALLLAALFVGCGESKPAETKAPETNAPETQAPENKDLFWFSYNGVEVHLGVPYAELKDKLGSETQPSETINSCDPNSDWVQICHFYNGFTVNEDKNGNVFGIEMTGSEAALNGVIKVGISNRDDIVKALGEPEPNEYGIFYNWNGYMLGLYLDEDTGLLSNAMVMESGN